MVISLIAVVRDVLLLPGGGPHHVHHHRLQQPPGVQPPAGPRPQPLFRGGLVDRSSSILNHNHLQIDFCCSLVLGLHQHPGLLPGRGPVRPAGPPRCFNGDQLTSIYSKHDIRVSPHLRRCPRSPSWQASCWPRSAPRCGRCCSAGAWPASGTASCTPTSWVSLPI